MEAKININELYLTIKQVYFDQIIAGTKTKEFREVRPSTIKRLLLLDENGNEITDEHGNSQPIPYKTIRFRVGMQKEADEAIVEVKNAYSEMFTDEEGELIEYVTNDKGETLLRDEAGKVYTEKEAQPEIAAGKAFFYVKPEFDEAGQCTNGQYWVAEQVVFELGKVISKTIVSK